MAKQLIIVWMLVLSLSALVNTNSISAQSSCLRTETRGIVDINPKSPTGQTNAAYLSAQSEALGRLYSTGCNRKPCINILRGQGVSGKLLPWSSIFNPGYWIPVVPNECIICAEDKNTIEIECPNGNLEPVPLAGTLIPQIAIRLYGLIASISMYGLVLVLMVLGIRYLVAGLNSQGTYRNPAANLRVVITAIVITMIIGTLVLQLLFTVLKLDDNALDIKPACIPTDSAEIYRKDQVTFCDNDMTTK